MLRDLRERSWLATSELGVFVLEREAAGFFLRTEEAAFPGVMLLELVGIVDGPLHESLSNNIISQRGERHRRLRRLVHDSFTPRAADRYRPAMRSCLVELVERVATAGRCDFVEAVAKLYPARLIADVLGAPPGGAARLAELSNLLQSQFDAIALTTRRQQLEAAAVEFDAYARALVAERRERPGEDLVSRLVTAREGRDRLSDDECAALVRDILNGGIDTTQSQLAHGVRLLAGQPQQWRLLAEQPARASAAAEEVLRFEPVAPFTTRVLLEPVEYRGVAFPARTLVAVSTFAANRDLAEGDPHSFDIAARRSPARSLSFGAGPHFCLGANLARAELQEALGLLPRALRELELDGEPRFGTITGLYGLESLPIRFAPPAGAEPSPAGA